MKLKNFLFTIFLMHASVHAIIFNGLVETGVSTNSFLCPANAPGCVSPNTNTQGFNFTQNQMLQIFNNQTYWLQQEIAQEQYIGQALLYSGTALQNKMTSSGWGAMGGYCIIISIDPILTKIVAPTLIAKTGQQKVVVQLWYNGDQMLQLWSQDAQILSSNQEFTVAISTAVDPLSGISATPTSASTTFVDTFLTNLHLQQSSRNQATYQAASASPRSVTIQTS